MKIYHRTRQSKAKVILLEGFKDSTGRYMTENLYTGVWFSSYPLGINEGAGGDVVLMLEIPEKIFKEYEWVEDGKNYRESLIPASIVNKYGPPVVVDEDDFPEDPRFDFPIP